MNVVLVEREEVGAENIVRLSGPRADHVTRVLRLDVGDSLRVGIIDGPLGRARISAREGSSWILETEWQEIPRRPSLHVLLALPRPKVLGRLYSPLAQLGIAQLMLVNAAKVERSYFDAHQLAPEYARAQFLEGLAQAKDTWLPRCSIHRSFRKMMEDELDLHVPPRVARLLAHPGEAQHVFDACTRAEECVIAIGPEGGFTDFELDLLRSHGFQGVSLGSRTLRTDVATIALVSAIANRRF